MHTDKLFSLMQLKKGKEDIRSRSRAGAICPGHWAMTVGWASRFQQPENRLGHGTDGTQQSVICWVEERESRGYFPGLSARAMAVSCRVGSTVEE